MVVETPIFRENRSLRRPQGVGSRRAGRRAQATFLESRTQLLLRRLAGGNLRFAQNAAQVDAGTKFRSQRHPVEPQSPQARLHRGHLQQRRPLTGGAQLNPVLLGEIDHQGRHGKAGGAPRLQSAGQLQAGLIQSLDDSPPPPQYCRVPEWWERFRPEKLFLATTTRVRMCAAARSEGRFGSSRSFSRRATAAKADEVQPQIPPTLLDKRLVHHKVK